MTVTLSPNFTINSFTIHSVEGASCINFGNNEPTGFTSYKKQNQGFGSISGDSNTVDGIKTLLNDKALLDMFSDVSAEDVTSVRDLMMTKVMAYFADEEDDEY